ncbi:MAG: hypothetical protein IPN69_23340 [Acidobacteria bacterium]|nr:hypothetical protein [Acidobacteriota bacterium]MBK8813644.1 hypothetical protein [Acidobacteriota bacterium]
MRKVRGGEGRRVKKITWNTQGVTETTIFVYSAGKLVAEYSNTQVPVPNRTTRYLTEDHLGTPRVITDSEGNVISRRDFLPFGEEITPDIGSRASVAAYQPTNDSVRQKFTGYQKDTETGLDFAEARMYENRHGRFTAVDPLLASGKSANPQTFNRFVYCTNRPLVCVDSDGKKPVYIYRDFGTWTRWRRIDDTSKRFRYLTNRTNKYRVYNGSRGAIIQTKDGGAYYQLSQEGFKLAIPVRANEKEFDPTNNPIVGFNVAGAFVSSLTADLIGFGDADSTEFRNSKAALDIMQYASMVKSLGKLGITGGAAFWAIVKATVNNPDDIGKLAFSITKSAKIGECFKVAEALEDTFKAKNVAGEVIEMRTATGRAIEIVSDTVGGAESISTNGIHRAVRVGDMVFDNIHKEGISYAEWVKDFHSQDPLIVDVVRSF